MIIYYDHKRRGCFVEDSGRQSKPISVEQAKLAYMNGQVEDCNIAFNRLAEHGWDMEAVEAYYREADGNA